MGLTMGRRDAARTPRPRQADGSLRSALLRAPGCTRDERVPRRASFGALRKEEEGKRLECYLTTDFNALAGAVRPFRAIHHLREAKIVNVTSRPLPADYVASIGERFGTRIVAAGGDHPVVQARLRLPEDPR